MSVSVAPGATRHDVQVHLLRDFAVRCDGEDLCLAPTSQRLVGFLAVQSGPVNRAFVSGSLWPDVDEQHARACLRSALWRLRPHEVVESSSTHMWLGRDVEVDLHRLTRFAVTVLRAHSSEDAGPIDLHELLDTCDDILVGWYDDWVIAERERFRLIRLHALERIGQWLIDSGEWEDALEVGLVIARSEPLRESAQRLLMQVHLLLGNIADAVAQYREYTRELWEQFSLRPSGQMEGLIAPHLTSPTL